MGGEVGWGRGGVCIWLCGKNNIIVVSVPIRWSIQPVGYA